VHTARQAFLAEEKETEECGLKKEGEDPFHGEWHANDAPRTAGKLRPVGAELEFHWNPGNHAEDEIDGEDLCPKPGAYVISFIAVFKRKSFEDNDEQRQPHYELRKQIMKSDGEGEVNSVKRERVHRCLLVA